MRRAAAVLAVLALAASVASCGGHGSSPRDYVARCVTAGQRLERLALRPIGHVEMSIADPVIEAAGPPPRIACAFSAGGKDGALHARVTCGAELEDGCVRVDAASLGGSALRLRADP